MHLLQRRLHDRDRGAKSFLVFKDQMTGGDRRGVQGAERLVDHAEDGVQIVGVARDERIAKRVAAQCVEDAVHRRYAGPDAARSLHQPGCPRVIKGN